ncbi:hypothetical protein TSUD_38300 [Trifolium subterraneum]|uniref:Pectate lyase superfamily protein domain-containing protein n=1 Tax=Trifolium subterraneum TaxID=3900 RepID=A0A2Z6MPJ0_TRISU|nr:hypothetical protein TSUD_38300 [Trifolium subterraneum]
MATARTRFLLGIAFIYCSLIGRASAGFGDRRSHPSDGGLTPATPTTTGATTPTTGIFDVKSFGAVADDKTDNVQALRAAWMAACKNSATPATLLIPQGTFRTGPTLFAGPCTSPKPITVEVTGTLTATSDLSDYVSPEWINFLNVDGLVLKGSGVFDGKGADIVKDITSLNSKEFHFHLHGCSNISFNNLTITAPGNSPNTDGMHISTSSFINVTNSIIGTGDDCISIGHSTSTISISGVTCGPGHGISVGSLGKRPEERTVDGVHVKNCTFINTTNGARIKTFIGTVAAEAKNIIYEDLIMNGADNPIIIDQSYGGKRKPKVASTSLWKISNVHFRRIQGTSIANIPVSLQCSSKNPCEAVEVADVDLSYVGLTKNTGFISSCTNAKATFGGKLNPPACQL